MRHADAGTPDPSRWPDDRERPLSDRGREEHRRVALGLRRAGVVFDRLLASPLRRARETAAITAEVFGWPGAPEVTAALDPRTPLEEVALLVAAAAPARVLCVGHEPHISAAGRLLLPPGVGPGALPPSGVIGLAFAGVRAPGAATLAFVWGPAELGRRAGHA